MESNNIRFSDDQRAEGGLTKPNWSSLYANEYVRVYVFNLLEAVN